MDRELRSYDFTKSTEDNYAVANAEEAHCAGKFAKFREMLDYSYHKHYCESRQLFHDRLIDKFNETLIYDGDLICDRPTENWVVFTAGAMGAGKSHTLHWLNMRGYFPLLAFVRVDPDSLRELLPETDEYIRRDATTAGQLTQKEVGYISEVLALNALEQGKNLLIDGSLRNAQWYIQYIASLRSKFPRLKFAIIAVVAAEETIRARAANRARETGRFVPDFIMKETIEQLPKSLATLSPLVDVVVTFANEADDDEPHIVPISRSWDCTPSPPSSSSSPQLLSVSSLQLSNHDALSSSTNSRPTADSESPVICHSPSNLEEFRSLWKMTCPMPSQSMERNRNRAASLWV